MASNIAVRRGRVSVSTANSMNSKPWQTGGGGAAMPGTRAGVASLLGALSSSSSSNSERMPSIAVGRGGAARNSSLKISSEIGPL